MHIDIGKHSINCPLSCKLYFEKEMKFQIKRLLQSAGNLRGLVSGLRQSAAMFTRSSLKLPRWRTSNQKVGIGVQSLLFPKTVGLTIPFSQNLGSTEIMTNLS